MELSASKVKVKSKIWLEAEDEVIFGLGRIRLFEAIEQTGSINRAAAALNMSYRSAWGKVTATEKRLQIPLVERHQGSREQGSTLTEEGKELLRRYRLFHAEALRRVDETFQEYLGDFFNRKKM